MLSLISRSLLPALGNQSFDHVGVETALDRLDPFVQRLLGVAGNDGNGLLGEDRSGVDIFGDQMDGTARDLHSGIDCVAHGVPPLERGQQRRVGVDRPAPERVDERLREDGPEAGDRDEIHVVALERGHDLLGVRDPVEGGTEVGALHQDRLDPGRLRDPERSAGPVGQDHGDGKPPVEHRPKDGATPGSEDADPHARHPISRTGGLHEPQIPRITPETCFTFATSTGEGQEAPRRRSLRIPNARGRTRVDGKTPPTTSELIIMIAGAVMLVASFLDFAYKSSSWSTGAFPIATLLPLYGVIMALQIVLTKFANVNLPDKVVGFTWEQVHLVLGFLAGFMAIGWLITDLSNKGIGLYLEILGGIALAVGAVMMQRERQNRRDRLTGKDAAREPDQALARQHRDPRRRRGDARRLLPQLLHVFVLRPHLLRIGVERRQRPRLVRDRNRRGALRRRDGRAGRCGRLRRAG